MSEITGPFSEPQREVQHRQIAGGEARAAVFRRSYDAPIADVWEACTDPDRLRRGFLPVTGDLRPGGGFNLVGFLQCEVLRCEPPRLLAFSQAYEDLPVDEIELFLRGALPDDFDMDAFRAQPEIAAIADRAQQLWGALAKASGGTGTDAGEGRNHD